jgi:hypothetical protein
MFCALTLAEGFHAGLHGEPQLGDQVGTMDFFVGLADTVGTPEGLVDVVGWPDGFAETVGWSDGLADTVGSLEGLDETDGWLETDGFVNAHGRRGVRFGCIVRIIRSDHRMEKTHRC